MPPRYAELRCKSNFSFLAGASHPEELVDRAAELGLSALAVADRDGLYGVVRAHAQARRRGLPLVVGAEMTCEDLTPGGGSLVLLAADREGYANLCRLVTAARRGTVIELGGPRQPAPPGPPRRSSASASPPPVGGRSSAPPPGEPHPARPALAEPERGWPRRESPGVSLLAMLERARGLYVLYPGADAGVAARLREAFGRRLALAVARHHVAGEEARIAAARSVGERLGIPVAAVNDVHTHERRRQPLQDVLTCVRLGTTVEKAGRRLFPNAERTLKGPEEMARLWRDFPQGLEAAAAVADACRFRLDEIRGEHPLPPVLADPTLSPSPSGRGHSDSTEAKRGEGGITGMPLLRALVREGARWRYRGPPPEEVERQLARELDLVEQLGYSSYFLTVWDVVRFARSRGILCQGRGSAANSAVCFALGITSIDPVRMGLLFERFISAERGEPPDIDVDFEHERREEVIQYVYQKYGRDRAGMVCEVQSYRARSAIRDVGKALGLSLGQVDRLSKLLSSHDDVETVTPALLAQAGLEPEGSPAVRRALELAGEIAGFPRHLSIHVGGFVITRRPLDETVPIEPAAMPGRTVVQWDKDDLAELGLLKVDLLGLGMLTALSRSLRLLAGHRPAPACTAHESVAEPGTREASSAGVQLPYVEQRSDEPARRRQESCAGHQHPDSLAEIPAEDPAVYDMCCQADTIGVFQIESRAQMSLLPRLEPRRFYDLVISVAIIRPGPIQGGMVHPYLRRRDGIEAVRYPYEPLRPVLEKTLGVPLFQEQAMRLAVVAAGFTPGEADELRRAMTHKRSHARIEAMRARLVEGMAARHIPRQDAEAILRQLHGFAGYGFPESHAASFALLVYASAWLKRYHPAVFACALIDSQPMGFYAPHTLVEDAKRHGVEVRGVDACHSGWECSLEGPEPGTASAPGEVPALRLGLRLVRGLPRAVGEGILEARRLSPFASIEDLARRARLSRAWLSRLAEAGALRSLERGRRRALWRSLALSGDAGDLFAGRAPPEREAELPEPSAAEEVTLDYAATGLSERAHPMSLLRPALAGRGTRTARELGSMRDRAAVEVAGLVIVRQRPQTAKGIVFVSLEDETGIANLVVMPDVYHQYRPLVRASPFLLARGRVERTGRVVNVKVRELRPLALAPAVGPHSRDFH
ncbi:MAG TPA: DNA polymerase III subunit alpha [Anaeromyxobacteraceae bacterium]|nr:DNA polymerase III subunit alpha [Anaeromyxobacteraceae bacterium]